MNNYRTAPTSTTPLLQTEFQMKQNYFSQMIVSEFFSQTEINQNF